MAVEFVSIPGYPNYTISCTGIVKKNNKNTPLACRKKQDIWVVCLNGIARKLHVLLATVFVPKTDPTFDFVDFKNGNRDDLSLDNLVWTHKRPLGYLQTGTQLISVTEWQFTGGFFGKF